MLIDTHAHLYVDDYNNDLAQIIQQAKQKNVEKVLLPNIDTSTIESLKKVSKDYPDFFFPMMGLHPTSVKSDYKTQLNTVYNELYNSNKYIAVGEIGIDLYWDTTFIKEQIDVFETQLRWSIEKDLPVSIHSRNSYKEIMLSLRRVDENKLRGVFHSFSGSDTDLKELLQFKNFYFGINGVVTFKNSSLSTVLKNCPIERIVLETDCPYLTPVPFRGKRNQPAYLGYINDTLANIFNVNATKMAQITKTNAMHAFDLNI